MKKYLLIPLLFIASFVFGEQFSIDDLSEGLVTKYDSVLIPDNAVSDAQNVLFDGLSTVTKRKGMLKVNTTQLGSSNDRNIYGKYEYIKSNGIKYQIVQSSNTLYYRTSGDTFTAFSSTMSKTYPCNYAVFIDTLQFCNGVDNLTYWTGSSTGITTASYQPRYIISWSNRLWIAGDSDEPTKVRACEWLDPTNWTIPTANALATDPVVFDINSQDGQKVTGFFISPNGALGIVKERSTWEIYGNDRDDYSLRLINNDLGCVGNGSIAYNKGNVTWLSAKGFVEYNGNSIKIISENIEDYINNLQQLDTGNFVFLKEKYSDWNNYTSTNSININTSNKIEFEPTLSTTTGSGSYTNVLKIGNTYYMMYNKSDTGYLNIYAYDEARSSSTFYTDTNRTIPFSYLSGYDTTYTNMLKRPYTTSVKGNIGIYHTNFRSISMPDYDYCESQIIKFSTSTLTFSLLPTLFLGFDSSRQAPIGIDSNDNIYILANRDGGAGTHRLNKYNRSVNEWTNVDLTYLKPIAIGAPFNGWVVDSFYSRGLDVVVSTVTGKAYCAASLAYRYKDINPTYFAENALKISVVSLSDLSVSDNYIIDSYTVEGTTNLDIYTGISITMNAAKTVPYLCYHDRTDNYVKLSYLSGSSWVTSDVFSYTGDIYKLKLQIFIDQNDTIYIVRNFQNASGVHGCRVYFRRSGVTDWSSFTPKNQEDRYYHLSQGDTSPIASFINTTGNLATLVRETTSYYISDIYNTGVDTSTLTAFYTDYGTYIAEPYHYYRTSDTASNILGEGWTSITANTSHDSEIYKYLQYKCVFTTDTLTNLNEKSYVSKINLNYTNSSQVSTIYSIAYDDRVWNAIGKDVSTYLDKILIYDSRGKWSIFTSTKQVKCLGMFDGKPYMGDTQGYIYELDQTDSDDGEDIDAYFVTKSYSLGNIVNYKNLKKLFLVADYSGNWNLNLNYYLNRLSSENESFAIDLDQTAGIINYKVPLRKNDPFTTIRFKVYNSNANEPFDFFGITGIYENQPLR